MMHYLYTNNNILFLHGKIKYSFHVDPTLPRRRRSNTRATSPGWHPTQQRESESDSVSSRKIELAALSNKKVFV